MTTLILRSLRAHRSRLTLTIVAVAAAVSFVTASFVLADSLRAVFGDVATEIYDGVDAEIRAGSGDFDTRNTGDRFDAVALDGLDNVNGIAAVTPVLGGENVVFSVDADGAALRQTGPPTLTFSTFGDSPASPFTTVTGAPPGPGEVMLDTAQARTLGVGVGDDVRVASPDGTSTYTLSGTVVFGVEESGVSPYFLLFDLSSMQNLLDAPGQIDSASLVFDDGVNLDQVRPAIDTLLPDNLTVADQSTLVAEQNSEFGEVIDMIGTTLLVFAAITLFVSTFVIANTFAVIVGQQRQQIGLLRAVGARRGQTTAVVVSEAAVVGLIASAVGIAGGLGVAEGIKALVEAVTTGGFPDGPTRLLPRTIGVALLVGVGATTLSAFIPARRAGAVAPLEAMRPDANNALGATGRIGLMSQRLLGATLGRVGPAGQLASTGVSRNPRRVLATSMSMIVGLSVIATTAVLATSYRATLEEAVTGGLDADLIVTGDAGATVPYAAVDGLLALPEVAAGSGYGITEVLHNGEVTNIAGHQSATAGGVVRFDLAAGSIGQLTNTEAYVTEDFAATTGVGVGDLTSVEFSDGFTTELIIKAIIAESSVVDAPIIVDASLVADHARNIDASIGAVRFVDGVNRNEAEAAAALALGSYPQVAVQTLSEHVASRQAQADQLLALANGLLALTIAVALTGIANTVALGVIERRAELGLLRSVGMSRRQVRRMVRYEAFAMSGFGAVVGIGLGTGVAALAVAVLPDSFVDTLRIPFGSLAIYAALCVGFGVLAAALPARRAAKLDVLDAIAIPT